MAMRRFPAGRLIAALAWAGAMACSSAAHAEIYKWVDEKGVTNYSSAPPAAGKARIVNLETVSVSVYQAPPPQDAARTLDAMMRQRVAMLENQLLAERLGRQTRQSPAQAETDRYPLAYEQCVRDRRVDCDQVRDGLPATNYYGPYYVSTYTTPAVPFLLGGRRFRPPQFMPAGIPPIFAAAAKLPGGPPRVAGHGGSRVAVRNRN